MGYKHLSLNNRIDIENGPVSDFKFTGIARLLNKSKSCLNT